VKTGAALLARRSGALPGAEQLIAEARAFAAQASRAPCRLQLCLALDEPLAYLYLWGESPGSFSPPGAAPWTDVARLEVLSSRAGASASEPASIHYVVATDVEPGWEKEFNDWYEYEHLAGLAAVPGCVLASRLRNLDAGPRYHACYDLVSPQVLEHPAWLAVRHTAWSDRVRPQFVNTRRAMFRVPLQETATAGAHAAKV
jgi:hypothetical protein